MCKADVTMLSLQDNCSVFPYKLFVLPRLVADFTIVVVEGTHG